MKIIFGTSPSRARACSVAKKTHKCVECFFRKTRIRLSHCRYCSSQGTSEYTQAPSFLIQVFIFPCKCLRLNLQNVLWSSDRETERERERDPAHHTLLLGKSLGTQRLKIHNAVTIVPRLFTFAFSGPPYPRRILAKVLYQTDRIPTLRSF